MFINSAILCNSAIKHNSDIRTALINDKLANEIVNALRNGSKTLGNSKNGPKVPLGECTLDSTGLLFVYGLLYVPNDENLYREVIHAHHDHPAAGHPGRAATYELVSRNYWWPGMCKTIVRYLANCDTCARIKPVRHAPSGLLKPLQVPVVRWSSVSMDFITALPESKPPGFEDPGTSGSNIRGFNAILVVVDPLTKMAHYIPTREYTNSEQVARMYFDNIFWLHGLPDSIIIEVPSSPLHSPEPCANLLASPRTSPPASIPKLMARPRELMPSWNNT